MANYFAGDTDRGTEKRGHMPRISNKWAGVAIVPSPTIYWMHYLSRLASPSAA